MRRLLDSWAAQWQGVSLVNFVRKKQPEIQTLRARILKRNWEAFEQTSARGIISVPR